MRSQDLSLVVGYAHLDGCIWYRRMRDVKRVATKAYVVPSGVLARGESYRAVTTSYVDAETGRRWFSTARYKLRDHVVCFHMAGKHTQLIP